MIPLTTTSRQSQLGDRIQLLHGSIATIARIDHKGYWVRGSKKRLSCYSDCSTFKLVPVGMNEQEFTNRSWRDRVQTIDIRSVVVLEGVRIDDELMEDLTTRENEE